MITNENVLKEQKGITKKIFIWIFIIFASFGLFILGDYLNEKDKNKSENLETIIMSKDENKESLHTFVEVKKNPYKFAVSNDTTDAYYILTDGNYLYVAYMSESDYNKVNDENDYDGTIKIEGITGIPSSDVKKLAIDTYNELFEAELTTADYDIYFGDVYIDMTKEYSSSTNILIVIGFIALLVGIICWIINIAKKISYSKNIKKLSRVELKHINDELNDPKSFYYNYAKVYLTENYIVSISLPFCVIKYADILWMYKHVQRTNGIKTNEAIILKDMFNKSYSVASMSLSTKAKTEQFEEIMNTISQKNPNILVGYTKENINEYKTKMKRRK